MVLARGYKPLDYYIMRYQKMKSTFYLVTLNDDLQLPLITCETLKEVSKFTGKSVSWIKQAVNESGVKTIGKYLVHTMKD